MSVRDDLAFLTRAPVGERFIRFYAHRQLSRRRPWLRLVLLGAGGLTIALGIVLLPAPGPGSLVIIAGAAMLAGESQAVARQLDRLERALRAGLAKMRRWMQKA